MKTNLPAQIKTEADVISFFTELHKNGEMFHPEDAPETIIDVKGDPLFTMEESNKINTLMGQVFSICEDPCGIALDIINTEN